MRDELEQKLFEKYPEIFIEKDWSENESCMHYGVCCPNGWYDLLDEVCQSITSYCKENNVPITRATQIKEKFGTLRFYVHGSPKDNYEDNKINEFINIAEAKSAKVCCNCGAEATQQDYCYRYCDEHVPNKEDTDDF